MTQTHTTPAESSNQPEPKELTDNKGNPINEDGTPREPENNNEPEPTVESLQKQLKDTKAALTKAQQGKSEENDEGGEEDKTKEPTNSLEIDAQTKEAEKAGVDMNALSAEYSQNGELSEDTYKDLEARGFGKEAVDGYIAGQEALMKQQVSEVASSVGGEDKFDALKEWAAENLSETEIKAFNDAVVQGTDSAKLAVQGLNARYVAANGQSPNLIGGETNTNNAGDIFKSSHEMVKAMGDKRYTSDPDYQKEVQAKVQRSMKAGTIK